MCQQIKHKDDLPAIIDPCDESKFVSGNVKDGPSANKVSVSVVAADIGERVPLRSTGGLQPLTQARASLRVLLDIISDPLRSDDSHSFLC